MTREMLKQKIKNCLESVFGNYGIVDDIENEIEMEYQEISNLIKTSIIDEVFIYVDNAKKQDDYFMTFNIQYKVYGDKFISYNLQKSLVVMYKAIY